MNDTSDTLYDLAVIGGGPAGMMAAGRAAERGFTVILLEKNNTRAVRLYTETITSIVAGLFSATRNSRVLLCT